MAETRDESITLEVLGKIAIITLNIERKLNALTSELYYLLGKLLREVATKDEVVATVLIGNGRYFSASTKRRRPVFLVTIMYVVAFLSSTRQTGLTNRQSRIVLAVNIEVTRAFYTHPKILITALNGPVLGLTAGLISHSDFIYATDNAFLLTPYTSLGLVTEGASSIAFVRRMGIAKANEALILSKRISAQELLETGFVNKLFPNQPGVSFRETVLAYVKDQLGDHLNDESMLKAKALIRAPDMDLMEQQNAKEVFGGLERLALGIPQAEFSKIASGAKRHKL
ncbi:hypothetical protein FGG08_002295 [Glutinoglossum americanum]|uniref:Uncharacterized protein n=1 Tax=Glutinoglossum americanum TaxID=1670608 RepID=A0A9P8L4K6_9PEZI|nr:hypothetical protein FGG08_002295 [Glutinoglossum americanum]